MSPKPRSLYFKIQKVFFLALADANLQFICVEVIAYQGAKVVHSSLESLPWDVTYMKDASRFPKQASPMHSRAEFSNGR